MPKLSERLKMRHPIGELVYYCRFQPTLHPGAFLHARVILGGNLGLSYLNRFYVYYRNSLFNRVVFTAASI